MGMCAQPVEEDDDAEEMPATHNKITAVIGVEDGLGVESLQGAARIAAETSVANREIFTLAYCTARNIGIGSYVLRLGQRVIQQQDAPIILTGYLALNKLLGTNVYESNLQLDGPEVMGGNGVSHLIVKNDLEAIHQITAWLAFVPKVRDRNRDGLCVRHIMNGRLPPAPGGQRAAAVPTHLRPRRALDHLRA